MDKDEKKAIALISSWGRIMLLGIGIPGIIGTGTLFGLKDKLVRDNFTLWVFWLTVGAVTISALLGMACQFALCSSNSDGCAKILFIYCFIVLMIGLIAVTILTTLQYT